MRIEPLDSLRIVDAPTRVFLRVQFETRGRGRPRSLIHTLVLFTLAGFVLAGCAEKDKAPVASQEAEKKPEAESRVKRGTNNEVTITLEANIQKVMGLETAPL